MTFKEARDHVLKLSCALYKQGIRKGDSVCLYLDRCLMGVYLTFAIPKLGAILAPCRASHTVGRWLHDHIKCGIPGQFGMVLHAETPK